MNFRKRVRRELRWFRDGVIRGRRVDKDHPLIMYAAFPKSASLFLLKSIANGTDLKSRSARPTEGFGQALIDRRRFRTCLDGRSVIYGHMLCDSQVRDLIRGYERRILVTIRPLPEVVASLRDHIRSTGESPLGPKLGGYPEYFPGYVDADRPTQLSYIIDYLIPWYFQFLVSWMEESRHSPVLWVPYERIADQPMAAVEQVARFCGTDFDRDRLQGYLADDPKVNFNKGVHGRGLEMLDQGLRDKLAALGAYHRDYIGDTGMDYLLNGVLPADFAGFGKAG